ncbi:MAG: 50S ribosomal protein L19 [Candidatus Moranbacteria bacterium GW2011_GWE2_35_2-]|nr:MAG: 50S ribosomal protein L19 [Candidatus Moranbacteria bacterium GW2011_GWE2_35_2-]KKQ06356.1 MAG: 50S ribosomal protein L19 [Candidatus Moranbacteria bacterium GW2011_GWF1_36_4]KKQ22203.1 MAG: 50S ribosomal protein L19 [Candidatus Moranbacteria bacterium GW2011_GWF2_37_11]KKQ28741.1 MAG: 50S ribosomal protein L19 [Candidatus Moranbacteria bacterium GW2011_GWD1_37_17]KKQ30305.1 MAG: 50S ribosomal protein L19 [Candidatus Moranbacteria bacterium GW2011_GWE1_37_24]KKQ47370.1 MAG: 50S ribosom
MQKKLIEFNMAQRGKTIPDLQTGDVVRVYRKIKEGEKERIQVFEGMIIAIKGGQSSSPVMTVRKVSVGVGVELILPMYSPMVEKIELVKRAKVRRSKLYYVREKTAKSLRFKYTDVKDIKTSKQEEMKNEVVEEKIEEEVKTEEIKEVPKKEDKKEEVSEKKEKEDQKENK